MSLSTLGAEAVLGFHPRWAGKNVSEPFVRVARPLVGVSLALLVFAIVLSLPAALGSAVPPPDLRATLSGVQAGDRVSYSLLLENVGGIPAVDGQVQFLLPTGFSPESGGGTPPILFPPLYNGDRLALAFVAVIDGSVAPGTVAVVAAHVGYAAPGGNETYETIAQSQISVAARGGPSGAWGRLPCPHAGRKTTPAPLRRRREWAGWPRSRCCSSRPIRDLRCGPRTDGRGRSRATRHGSARAGHPSPHRWRTRSPRPPSALRSRRSRSPRRGAAGSDAGRGSKERSSAAAADTEGSVSHDIAEQVDPGSCARYGIAHCCRT